MTVFNLSDSASYSVHYLTGMLDSAGVIYPSALAVKSYDAGVKESLRAQFGGHIEPGRWITRSVPTRQTVYQSWLHNTRSKARKQEIAAALYALEHRNG